MRALVVEIPHPLTQLPTCDCAMPDTIVFLDFDPILLDWPPAETATEPSPSEAPWRTGNSSPKDRNALRRADSP